MKGHRGWGGPRSAASWLVIALVLLVHAPSVAGEGLGPRTYRPPTAGVVIDPFRPPPEPWLSGNRGIEYATDPGSALVAIGPGVVVFAGSVAGRLVVSIDHPDGLRSALTGVASVEVDVGQVVMGGEPVARAATDVHLGVRRGATYLDPASLWGRRASGGRAVLVPTTDDASGGPNARLPRGSPEVGTETAEGPPAAVARALAAWG